MRNRLAAAAIIATIAVIVVGGAACGGADGDDCVNDPAGRHTAKNPATNACWEFTNSCDVPDEWANCSTDCGGIIDCAAGYTLVNCVCVPVGGGCTSDDDCGLTQHCDFTMPPGGGNVDPGVVASGTCVNNNFCIGDPDCPAGQWCDTSSTGGGGGGVPQPPPPPPQGVCTRGTRPGPVCGDLVCQTPESCSTCPGDCGTCTGMCFSNLDCGSGELCPAQYGYCGPIGPPPPPSPTPGPVPPVCSSDCQKACYDTSQCGTGMRCNNIDVCAIPNPKRGGLRLLVPCAGWCIPL